MVVLRLEGPGWGDGQGVSMISNPERTASLPRATSFSSEPITWAVSKWPGFCTGTTILSCLSKH